MAEKALSRGEIFVVDDDPAVRDTLSMVLSAGGYPVMLSHSLRLPAILLANGVAFAVLRHLHAWLAVLLFVTFLAHLGAALYHGLVRRDGVLGSMVGWRPRR